MLEPVAPPTGQDSDGNVALAKLRADLSGTHTVWGVSHVWQKNPDGTSDYNNARMALKRDHSRQPFTLAAYVLDARDSRTERTKLVFEGVSKVRLRTYFLGFLPIRITLAHDDPRLVDTYNRTLKDTSLDQMLGVLLHPKARTRLIGTYLLRGERLQLIEVRSPAMWPDVSKEIYGLSERHGMPIYRNTYNKAGKHFRHFDLEGLRIRMPANPDDFSLDS